MQSNLRAQPAGRKASLPAGGAPLDNRGATFPGPSSTPDATPSRTHERWRLRHQIGKLLRPEGEGRGPGVCACGAGGFNSDEVTLHLRDNGTRAGASGVYRCDSPWLCPVCAPRRAGERRERVEGVVVACDRMHGLFAMVTLTVRHTRSDRLEDLKRLVSEASRRARQGRAWTDIQRKASIAGVLSGPEVTYSRTAGWHYHVHLGIPCVTEYPDIVREACRKLVERYIGMVALLGGDAVQEAQDIQIAFSPTAAGEYLAKGSGSWEVAGSVGTKTYASGLTPFAIAAAAATGDPAMRALWLEYSEVMPGTRSCIVTKRMAEHLEIKPDEDDDAPGEAQEQDCVVGTLDREVWDTCHRRGFTARILGRLETEGAGAWPLIRQEAIDLGRPSPIVRDLPRTYLTASEIVGRCVMIAGKRPPSSLVGKVIDEAKARARKEQRFLVLPTDREIIASFLS